MLHMITGHRPGSKLNEAEALEGMLTYLEREKRKDKDLIVISGGADGVDRLWARAGYKLELPIHVYVPYGYWKHYKCGGWAQNLLWTADEIVWTQPFGEKFNTKYNHQRNEQMVDAADIHVVCSLVSPEDLMQTKRGGTRHCVGVMLERGINPVWISSLTGEIRYPSES